MGKAVDIITSIIGNRPLATAIRTSISSGLKTSFFNSGPHKTVWDVFESSLNAAIRNIEHHPKGCLFRRLIEYGPHDPDEPIALESDGKTLLSDRECGECVEFIFSHMVNRFKGELAELLAVAPCITLLRRLQEEGRLHTSLKLYWGEIIKERRRILGPHTSKIGWGGFAKGADGLLFQKGGRERSHIGSGHDVVGIVEVKSMKQSPKKILGQIERHIGRLAAGVRLGDKEYSPNEIILNLTGLFRIMVVPATWKLSREWHAEKTERGHAIVLANPEGTPAEPKYEELAPRRWKITLAWSQDVLEQAAYEMTFWYMSQVGKSIYTGKTLPKGWEYMTPEDAGYNAIKEKLYYIPLRYISLRQERLATKLYNVYSFGYPLGVDSKEMLWPQDFPHTNQLRLI